MAVALKFLFSTEGKIGREDFERAVEKILGHGLPAVLVSAPCTADMQEVVCPSILSSSNESSLSQHS